MIIVRLLSPGPFGWLAPPKFTRVQGADIVMQSIAQTSGRECKRLTSAPCAGRLHWPGTHESYIYWGSALRLRCASDRGQHLLPYQTTEWFDQHPIREKASPGGGVRAQYSSLGPKLRCAVRPCTHFEVPCGLRGSRRSGHTESNWAGCAQFSTGSPKATHCAEQEFFAGPLLKQSEAFREHGVESKTLLK